MINSLSLFLLSLWLFTLCHNVNSYSQISAYGSGTPDEGPKIFKALNADLIYPKIFNSSSNVISTTSKPLFIPPSMPASQSFVSNNEQDDSNVSEAVMQSMPLIYVTPPTSEQTTFTPQLHNKQVIGSNQMLNMMKIDYQKQAMQEATHESQAINDDNSQMQQQLHLQQKQEQQQHEQYASTGRAVDYRPAYQFDQFTNAAPIQPYVLRPPGSYAIQPQKAQTTQYGNRKMVPYPQSSYRQYKRPPQAIRRPLSQSDNYKLNGGRAQISDRFTPGEAVASSLFFQKGKKHHNHNHQNHNHNQGGKLAAPSNFVQSVVKPNDLYSFPPNIKAKYPKPSDDPKAFLPSSNVNSYVPPPAGLISNTVGYPLATSASSDSGYKYPGPVSQAYLPPNSDNDDKTNDADSAKPADNDGGDDTGGNDDTIGVLPASAMDTGDDNKALNGDDGTGGDMKDMDDMNPMPNDHDHDHSYDHDHGHPFTGYDTGKEYPTPPPGWMEEHPGSDSDHFHHYPHHFPDIIYDDHHHYHHHDEPPPTTIPPPPEPLPSEQPQEPRVKKYSYFYIGRKLWYIPLYFTVWFSFYVLWLILKSIARHKVNLPNHYVARRSLPEFSNANAKDYINQLTVSVMQQIEGFQTKYLT